MIAQKDLKMFLKGHKMWFTCLRERENIGPISYTWKNRKITNFLERYLPPSYNKCNKKQKLQAYYVFLQLTKY